jgi:hypothetical protein
MLIVGTRWTMDQFKLFSHLVHVLVSRSTLGTVAGFESELIGGGSSVDVGVDVAVPFLGHKSIHCSNNKPDSIV